jgi:hypothetical protein
MGELGNLSCPQKGGLLGVIGWRANIRWSRQNQQRKLLGA